MAKSTSNSSAELSVIGVDIGKDVFHLVAFDGDGKIAFRRIAVMPDEARDVRCVN